MAEDGQKSQDGVETPQQDQGRDGKQAEALMARLQQADGLMVREIEPPGVPVLVHYLKGSLPRTLAFKVECGLTRHPQARRTLRDVRLSLQQLAGLSEAEVERACHAENLHAEVALEWLSVLYERPDSPGARPALWPGWAALRREAEYGVAAVWAAWAALEDFVQDIANDMRQPQIALARGTVMGQTVTITDLPTEVRAAYPTGLTATLTTAEIDDRGQFHVLLELDRLELDRLELEPSELDGPESNPSQESVASLAGRRLSLALTLGDEVWPLEWATIADRHVRWQLNGFGKVLRMPAGEFPARYLHFALD